MTEPVVGDLSWLIVPQAGAKGRSSLAATPIQSSDAVPAAVRRGSRILPEGEGSCWSLRRFTESWAHSVRCAYSLSR